MTEKKTTKKKEEAPEIRVTVKGEEYILAFGDIDGLEARDFRREVGLGIAPAFEAVARGEMDNLELVAGIVWLVQRRDDPNLDFEKVLKSISYKDVVDLGGSDADPPTE